MSFKIGDAPVQYQPQLRKADANEDKELGYNDLIDTPKEAKTALDLIKPGNNISEVQAEESLKALLGIADKKGVSVKGEDMIGNAKFALISGKIYAYKGAQVQVKDNMMKVSFDSEVDNGVVHEYDGGDWNGAPFDISSYSKLHIIITKAVNIEGAKVELNDIQVIAIGDIKEGVNTIDLTKYKKDDFAPWKEISKINIVNKAGKGSYLVELKIE